MKAPHALLFIVIIVGAVLVFESQWDSLWMQKPKQIYQGVEAHVQNHKESASAKPLRERAKVPVAVAPKVNKDQASPQAKAELYALAEKMAKNGILDSAAMEAYRGPAERILRYDPQAYEEFLWDQIGQGGKQSVIFFLLSLYLEQHNSPGGLIHKVLLRPSKLENENLVKIFAIEGLFHRADTGADFSVDPLPQVRDDLVQIVESNSNLSLVKEALLVLQGQYKYSRSSLLDLIKNRDDRDLLESIL